MGTRTNIAGVVWLGISTGCAGGSGRHGADADGGSGVVPAQDTEDGTASSGDTEGASGDSGDGSAGSASGHGVRFDVGAPEGDPLACGGAGDLSSISFSYIWIANSEQGTISKIDTQTMVEVGRYLVSPTGSGLPSRTSVNLSGDVAVANRTGGITKVYADVADCQESNGTPGIQTSTGPDDILPWGQEECIAWYTPMTYGSQRPIAWTSGNYNPDTCEWEDQQVWTTGTTTAGFADVILLDGETGTVDDMITVSGLDGSNTYGGYGAVVDTEGNLWFNEMFFFGDSLVRVSLSDMSYTLIPTGGRSGYGIARDADGRIWTCGGSQVNRYDPLTSTWESAANAGLTYGGCMVDAQGRLWVSGSNGTPSMIKAFDTDTVTEVASFSLPEHVHGVSIDFQGYVWGVAGVPGEGLGERAYRIDPETGQYGTVEGLVGAYTYSDMTGFALVGSTAPPG